MRTNLTNLIRLSVLAAVLGFAMAPSAAAQRSSSSARSSTVSLRSTRDSDDAEEPRSDPMAGLIWIGGALVGLIFLAWLAMRIGDPKSPADGVPN